MESVKNGIVFTHPMASGTEQRYRSLAVEAHRVDGGLTLLNALSTSDVYVVSSVAAAVLGNCLAERPIDAHVEHAARVLRQPVELTRDHVLSLVAEGLLRPIERLQTTGNGAVREAPSGATISSVAIVTADRPTQLARCLASYLRHLEAHGRTLPVLVVDGSRDDGNASEVQRLVAEAGRVAARDVRYLGPASRRAIRTRAEAHGVAPDILEWLLPDRPVLGFAGVVRNQVLLSTVGQALLSADDDTVGEVWELDQREPGLALAGHVDPRETQCFASRADAFAAVAGGRRVDLIEQHEALLGHRCHELAETWCDQRNLDDVCPHLLPVLEGARPNWQVALTWGGVAGDAATYCPYPVLFASNVTRERLAASEDALDLALSSREVVRAVRRFTLTDQPWFMSYCAGMDNRRLLPPFSPALRNEDGLFAAMLRMCDPDAFVGQVPCGVLHDSSRSSLRDAGVIASASTTRTAEVVQWLAAPFVAAHLSSDSASRMCGLGAFLVECGRLDLPAWKALLTSAAVAAKRRSLVAVEMVLSRDFAYPIHMRQAIRRYQQAALNSTTSATLIIPAEYRDRPSSDHAIEDLQTYVSRFGEALMAWPAIWNAQCE